MTEKVRVIIIDDDAALAAHAKREIEEAFDGSSEIQVEVTTELDFDKGFDLVRTHSYDVVVLDVRRDPIRNTPEDTTAGRKVYHDIKEVCFAPVVFWTALPEEVKSESMPPLVTVVSKDQLDGIPKAIEAAVSSRALTTIKGIESDLAEVLRKHMWTELAPNWTEYTGDTDLTDIAHVLLSRLARDLAERRDGKLAARPSHRYLYPPVSDRRSAGDVLRATDQTWYVVLTPACDFAQGKVEYVLLAKAGPLAEHPKYQKWADATSSGQKRDAWNNLCRVVLRATSGRYHYLPAFREIPDLVIDLENVITTGSAKLDDFTWIASLASPFAEALLVQYSHIRGRIGVPDLDTDSIQQRLSQQC